MNRRNVEVQVYDATVHDPEKEKYADVVLMDVPCSGLGVMGKKRDIKYHATPESCNPSQNCKGRLCSRMAVCEAARCTALQYLHDPPRGKSGDGSLDHREFPVCTGRRETASAGNG